MHPIIRVVVLPGLRALAILLVGAAGASAQERPAGSPVTGPAPPTAAGAWSGYRPGSAWAGSIGALSAAGRTPTPVPSAPARAPVYASRRGWATYAPSSSWAGYRSVPALTPGPRADVYASRRGWATYAPSTAWTGYAPAAGWQGYYPPQRPRSLNMRQAHVPGPSPYADGLARNYYEYGTGRMVPLAKPWLPGSP